LTPHTSRSTVNPKPVNVAADDQELSAESTSSAVE
jgi:hypothetical protein